MNFGAADRAETIALGAREEVRALGEQVTALRRMVQRLQSRLDGGEGGRT